MPWGTPKPKKNKGDASGATPAKDDVEAAGLRRGSTAAKELEAMRDKLDKEKEEIEAHRLLVSCLPEKDALAYSVWRQTEGADDGASSTAVACAAAACGGP